jgi:methyl-accepting chemotaxis protein
MTLKLKHKIVVLAVFSALLPALVMSVLSFIQGREVQQIISHELTNVIQTNLKYVALDVYKMCQISNSIVTEKISFDLNVARKIMHDDGGASLSPTEKVEWKAENQFTKEIVTKELPRMLIGEQWTGQVKDFNHKVPVVDEVKELLGVTCTVFQRMNERGDLLRVATSVPKLNGERAIGTYIPAINPDGTPNAVVSTVMGRKTYNGRAFVVNAWYITAYEPIKNQKGEVIGCLYVGIQLNAMERMKKIIQQTMIGKTGYVVVVGGSGKEKGKYIISFNGKRDGENILESIDTRGNFFIREIIEDSMKLDKGNVGFKSYYWKNASDKKTRLKTGAYIYFEPWDWVIMPTIYADDYAILHKQIESCIDKLLWYVMIGGVIIVCFAALIALYLGNKIGNPISKVIEISRLIADGNINMALQGLHNLGQGTLESDEFNEKSLDQDETGLLISSIAKMTKNLNALVGQVQRSTIQLVSTATEIAASSKEQEATVNELGASTNEIVASSRQISSTSNQLVNTMDHVAEVSDQTAEFANEGQVSLNDMGNTMQLLVGATESISTKLSIINEKAVNISNMVTTITKIADQTNLLSLNASIEAEKAGEYGKGFSVVAREIRRLADQTAVATLDIIKMVKDMQSAVSSGVMEMDKFSEEIRLGVEEIGGISSQLEKIISQVQELPSQFEIVTDGMKQQAEGAMQISESMVQLNDATRQTSESLKEFNEATGQLNEATQALKKEVSIFKVK